MPLTVGELRQEIKRTKLPSSARIVINGPDNPCYLHSCIGNKTGYLDHSGPYLELHIFEEVDEDEKKPSTVTVGDLCDEIERYHLSDDTPIHINSDEGDFYLHSCIGDFQGSSPFLELVVFDSPEDEE